MSFKWLEIAYNLLFLYITKLDFYSADHFFLVISCYSLLFLDIFRCWFLFLFCFTVDSFFFLFLYICYHFLYIILCIIPNQCSHYWKTQPTYCLFFTLLIPYTNYYLHLLFLIFFALLSLSWLCEHLDKSSFKQLTSCPYYLIFFLTDVITGSIAVWQWKHIQASTI